MTNLAIIPARGGSKRIPKKNIKHFNGKPIIASVISTVTKTNLFDEIMVSTDDPEIASIATKFGAQVPFLRSLNNSDDFATLTDVIIEVINEYSKMGRSFDNICCILPTAALVTQNRIQEAYTNLIELNLKTIVPVLKFSYPIQRALKEDNGLIKMKESNNLNSRSQDLETYYHDSGQFYWIRSSTILLEKKIFTDNTGFIELKEYEAQDVDTIDDWAMLQIKFKYIDNE